MTTGFNDAVMNAVTPAFYNGMKVVDYAKDIKAATDTIPKKEAPFAAKAVAPLFAFGYENSDKIAGAYKKVSNDVKTYVKENAQKSVENYEKASNLEKAIMGLTGRIQYQISK